TPLLAADSAASEAAAGRSATDWPALSSSAQDPEPRKPLPTRVIVPPAVGTEARVAPEISAAYEPFVLAGPAMPCRYRTSAGDEPGLPTGAVTTSWVSLRHCTGTFAPFNVAVTFSAANAVAVVPKPEPVTVAFVPPSGLSTAELLRAPLSGTMKFTAAT